MRNTTKIIAGTTCGVLAFSFRDFDDRNFAFWSMLAIAGNFYANVATDAMVEAWRGPRSVTPASHAARQLLVCSLALLSFIALAFVGQSVLVTLNARVLQFDSEYSDLMSVGLLILACLCGWVSAIGAGYAAFGGAEAFFQAVDRRSNKRPIYRLLQVASGILGFGIGGYVALATFWVRYGTFSLDQVILFRS
ncbi:hypothetical protein [Micromonospora sp. NPDC049171]|uniref:hypothetical protein n=1 Tax=Micromonospora sp. NPDC049171 TaxID=3155770 RepID=UPI0033C65838